ILASNVLCHTAFLEGFDVKKSEVHGMAQRGGTVITHVKYGSKVYSPLIVEGTADFLLAFEKLEALRYSHYLKNNGIAMVNDREIPPMSVLIGAAAYPADIPKQLKKHCRLYLVEAEKIALEMGNVRVVNIVLLGVLARVLQFQNNSWEQAIRSNVKTRYVDLNISAFRRGRDLVSIP
ncbi:MAG: indolepyruvate oxidoreductase subunit beta, partial [candidate division WOR-3 bacterium]